ncbi:Uncharacterised protein [Ralstonia pickettii]|uniref:hypothetical protein n=1 Tax=Ralstonia TaxID=48736 RepID=UPI000500E8F4|nr:MULTISPECIES: hypothetical protein [Ralstonia]KFL24298.1 hypothetical protein DP23_4072 [Ralstonia pickettii]MBU6522434.1 hypothetical protein [Ralstonia sp. B265]QQK33823.1 hypothetical protein RP6297_00005 [Ralstonia pickettii]UCA15796.1 hypothetical protein LA354_07330 [Ralstonia pickettii]SUE01040.1 Uncharacterised protein [Ralstonia pickettii]
MTEPQEANDMALNTLLSVGREVAPDLPEHLLRRVFNLQRSHQFDVDRDASLLDLQRAVEEFIGQSNAGEVAE